MAHRRKDNAPQISLFPFLSILACLAGAVVVMISMLSILQTTRAGQRATMGNPQVREFLELRDQLKAEQAELEKLTVLIERNEALKVDLFTLDQRIIKLRRLLDGAGDHEQISRELQKQLELVITQIEELEKEKPKLAGQIAELREELSRRQIGTREVAAPVRIQPSGSGFARGRRLYVVEAAKDTVVVHRSQNDKLRIAASTVGADQEYDAFLEKVAADRTALLLFLVRADGGSAYDRGAGWAEAKFQIPTSKMPIPGQGFVDLSVFEQFMK